jgi:GAF domain-containing protein
MLDPRFRERESVRIGRIEEVLCAPVGDCPLRGVLYLQGRVSAGPFTADDREVAEIFARHLGPIVGRLLVRERERSTGDPTRGVRQRLRCGQLLGRSSAMARLLEQLASVAPLDVSVLLTGHSGSGKSLVARMIHDNSARRGNRFVEVNCATLPEHLIESELFGAVAGAHSTATGRIDGKVAAAEHGTLLLDEVSDLPLVAQAKLLQLLQSRTYYPLGSGRPTSADVRVIAATNSDLERAVADRRFRADLFYHCTWCRSVSWPRGRREYRRLAVLFATSGRTPWLAGGRAVAASHVVLTAISGPATCGSSARGEAAVIRRRLRGGSGRAGPLHRLDRAAAQRRPLTRKRRHRFRWSSSRKCSRTAGGTSSIPPGASMSPARTSTT